MADEEERHPFLPEQDYEDSTIISTYDFIYFIDDYSSFLKEYLDYLYDPNDPEDADVNNYFKSFIGICEEIYTDAGDDGTFEQYRATLEPLMEFMTQACESMNAYHEENLQLAEEGVSNADAPKDVANRTRSKTPATKFNLPPNKKGTDTVTLEPTKQEGVRIKLSDGKEYTYPEIKNMWEWNKTMTPYRHPYTEEDKQKINELINFATKGGKKTRKNKKKTRKTTNKKKTRKTKKITNKRKVKRHSR